jgi:hypothetical protein
LERLLPAAFSTRLGEYQAEYALSVLGQLISARAASGFASQYMKQVSAWESECRLLEDFIRDLLICLPGSKTWALLLEFPIPRRNKFPDAILLADDLIYVIEFKFGATTFDATAKWQVEDYALDLRDFHLESAGRTVIPVLIASEASPIPTFPDRPSTQTVWPVLAGSPSNLVQLIEWAFRHAHQMARSPIDPVGWENSGYKPSLSIVEAATNLFGGHSVREISHAYADNLSRTTDAILEGIKEAKEHGSRLICFITGVPGAGKTLTGLNAVHDPEWSQGGKRGVFLSGNGPLVKIMSQALVRNAVSVRKMSRKDAVREVGTFVQNVHSFIKEYASGNRAPFENVVIFDEAQRAWNSAQVKKKRKLEKSEPEIMLEIMERCPEWCTIVALVGGGQEINTGEAGLEEWGRALARTGGRWCVLVSPEALIGGPSLAGHRLFADQPPPNCEVTERTSLHLDVSVRSFRAQTITNWVNFLLQGDAEIARQELEKAGEFPLVLTRDLARARNWLRERSRHEHRCGLVASSGSLRHRAYGLELSTEFRRGYPFEEWFLTDPTDFRSSYHLEVAATEFECQGLELDWVGLCWGDDFSWNPDEKTWQYRRLAGRSWQHVRNEVTRRYVLNKYRVLLTRAREGMIIWVPPGHPSDPTRDPNTMNATADFLLSAGVPNL